MARRRRKASGLRFLLRHRILIGATGAGLLIAIGLVAGVGLLLSGALSTSATVQHSALTHWILETGLRYSISTYSEDIEVPPLDRQSGMTRGLACFQAHCVECHGAPGVPPDPKALGMMPVPGNLTRAAREWPPAWLYHVTTKGIRMTGMPAWEYRLAERDRWSIVAFLTSLPELGGAQYRQALAATVEDCGGAADDGARQVAGEVVLRQYGCHSCHRIEGVVGPDAGVGPPLEGWPERSFIAGTLPNTRENLVRWIVDPQGVDPDTLMPDLGVSRPHARVMAEFLFEPR